MMNKMCLAVAVFTLVGSAALAQESEPTTDSSSSSETHLAETDAPAGPHGLELGLRAGYALPLGDAASGSKLSDITSGMVPLQLDVGYRINGNFFAGAYFQYGFGFLADGGCSGGGSADVSCSASDLRFGVQAQYHILPGQQIDPWVGLGIGYEIANISASSGGVSISSSIKGFEFANVSIGGDYRLTPKFGLGPVLGMTFGQYSSAFDTDIPEKSMHMWLTLGLRGVFDVM